MPQLAQFISFAPFLAIIAFWGQFKTLVQKLFSLIIRCQIIDEPVVERLFKYPRLLSPEFKFNRRNVFDKDGNSIPWIFRRSKYEIVLYRWFIPVIVYASGNNIKIIYLQYSFPFNKILQETCKLVSSDSFCISHLQNPSSKSSFSSTQSWAPTLPNASGNDSMYLYEKISESKAFSIQGKKIDRNKYYYRNPVQQLNAYVYSKTGLEIKSLVQKWIHARNWYLQKSIRYFRSVLLFGPPGTGKSQLIHEIAKDLQIPILIVNVSSISASTLIDYAKQSKYLTPYIVIFEDIDCVFSERNTVDTNITKDPVTFDILLNCLSGVSSLDNSFVFMTTNYPDKLDEALLRPGRVDYKFNYPSLDRDEKLIFAQRLIDNPNDANAIVEEGISDSTAEFENRLIKYCVDNYWSDTNNEIKYS